jgi:hypothetical protein
MPKPYHLRDFIVFVPAPSLSLYWFTLCLVLRPPPWERKLPCQCGKSTTRCLFLLNALVRSTLLLELQRGWEERGSRVRPLVHATSHSPLWSDTPRRVRDKIASSRSLRRTNLIGNPFSFNIDITQCVFTYVEDAGHKSQRGRWSPYDRPASQSSAFIAAATANT